MRYTDLRYGQFFREAPDVALRTVDRLKALKAQLARTVPPKSAERTLLLATWNIRDFGRDKFGHGWRTEEANHYIAQIIAAFDLVALQEIGGDLDVFRRLERLLGPSWDFIVTDVTDATGGNGERMCFVFDRRKVQFRNMAGEIVLDDRDAVGGFEEAVRLPEGSVIVDADGTETAVPAGSELRLPPGQEIVKRRQFARTPFLVAFQAGWFKFNLCTVHLYYGDDSGTGLERRIQEIDRIARFFVKRQKKERERFKEEENYILLGDFNIVEPDHRTMAALTGHGYEIPEALQRNPTNMLGTRHYDQIAFRARAGQMRPAVFRGHDSAGVLNFFDSVYRATVEDGIPEAIAAEASDADAYRHDFPEERIADLADEADIRAYYASKWRTWQMSDHLPMWVALEIDFSGDYLDATAREAGERLAPAPDG